MMNLTLQILFLIFSAVVAYFSYKYKSVKTLTFSLLIVLLNMSYYEEFLIKNPQGWSLLIFLLISLWINFCVYLFFYKNSYKILGFRLFYITLLCVLKYLDLGYIVIDDSNTLFNMDLSVVHFYLLFNYLNFITHNYSFFQLILFLVPGASSISVFLEPSDNKMYMIKNSKSTMDTLIFKIKEQKIPPSRIVLPNLELVDSGFLTKTTPFSLVCFEPLVNRTSLTDIFKFNAQNNGFIKYFQELAKNEQTIAFFQEHLKNYKCLTNEAFLFKRLVVPYNHQLNFKQLEICIQQGYAGASPDLVKELLKSLQMSTIMENGQKLQENSIDINKALSRLQSDRPIYREISSLRKVNSAINSISQAQTITFNLVSCDSVLKDEGIEVAEILKSDNDFFINTKNNEKIKFEVKNIYKLYNEAEFEEYLDGAFAEHIPREKRVEVQHASDICAKRLMVALESSLEPTDGMKQVIEKYNNKFFSENIVFSLKKI